MRVRVEYHGDKIKGTISEVTALGMNSWQLQTRLAGQ